MDHNWHIGVDILHRVSTYNCFLLPTLRKQEQELTITLYMTSHILPPRIRRTANL